MPKGISKTKITTSKDNDDSKPRKDRKEGKEKRKKEGSKESSGSKKRRTRSKKEESDEESELEHEQEEEEEHVEGDDDHVEQPELGNDDDDDDDDETAGKSKELTPEQKEARAKKSQSRARLLAKLRGYRQLARISGSAIGKKTRSIGTVSGHLDQLSNVMSLSEVERACKFLPNDPKQTAWSSFEEFEARANLAYEPLPRGPKAVLRPVLQGLVIQVLYDATMRTMEQNKGRISASTMNSVLRSLGPTLRFQYSAPLGLVRHAQTTILGQRVPNGPRGQMVIKEGATPALTIGPNDEAQAVEEAKILPMQTALIKKLASREAARKAARAKGPKKPSAEPVAAA